MNVVVERIKLKTMPFDKWDGHQHIHATGYAVRYAGSNKFQTEFEDDVVWSVDSPDCILLDEYEMEA